MRVVLSLGLLAGFAAAAHATPVVIDDFNTPNQTTANSGTPIDSSSVGSGIGGQRDDMSNWASGDNEISLESDAGGGGLLNFSAGADTTGTSMLTWDGGGAGLGGIDLTDGGSETGIGVGVFFDDLPVDLKFDLTDSNSNTATGTLSLGGGIFALTTEFIPFTDFAGVDVTSIDTIKLTICPIFPGTDLQIDFLESTTPEPTTFVLFGLAGMALVRRRR